MQYEQTLGGECEEADDGAIHDVDEQRRDRLRARRLAYRLVVTPALI